DVFRAMPWVGRPKSSNRAADIGPWCTFKGDRKSAAGCRTIDLCGPRWQSFASHPPDHSEHQPVRDREYPRELLAESTQPCAAGKHGGKDDDAGSGVSPKQSGDVLTGAAAHDVRAYQAPDRGHRR